AGGIHGREPPHHVAQQAEAAPDHPGPRLPAAARGPAEGGEHAPHQLPVVPLLLLDLPDAGALGGVGDRSPAAAVGVRGGQRAGVGELEDRQQPLPVPVGHQSTSPTMTSTTTWTLTLSSTTSPSMIP